MGLFLRSVPVLFKKYLTYQEIGVIMMATLPYSFKFFWAPVIEIYHWPLLGKRKSWIVPMQLVGCCVLLYLYSSIEQLLKDKEVYFLAGLLIFNTFVITCQDVAVDGWAVEILHPTNSAYASACQSVGLQLGFGLSTTLFVALNSVEFCNKWIFKDDSRTEPLLTIPGFIFYWAIAQFIITTYIAICVPEKTKFEVEEGEEEEEEEELTILPSQVLGITFDILKNKNLMTFLVFLFMTFAANSIQ